MTEKITFRLNKEMRDYLAEVTTTFNKEGLDVDDSKVIRYLINKGIEKLKLEGKIK